MYRWARLNEFRQVIHDRRLFGIVALTKCDLVDAKLTRDQSSIYDSKEVNHIVGTVAEKSGFDIRRVFPLKLYTAEPDRSATIECLAMNVLAEVVQQVSHACITAMPIYRHHLYMYTYHILQANLYIDLKTPSGVPSLPPPTSTASGYAHQSQPQPSAVMAVPSRSARAVPVGGGGGESKRPSSPSSASSSSSSTTVTATSSAPTAAEKLAMIQTKKRGYTITSDMLQYLRELNGDIDATIAALDEIAAL